MFEIRTLFTLDREDYSPDMSVCERFCVRALIMNNGKVLAQRSSRGEYKLPGGGIDAGESQSDALTREVLEETGYHLKAESVCEIGEITEKRKDIYDSRFIYLNHTYFYLCNVEDGQEELSLTPEEEAKGYTAVWETMSDIISANDAIQKDYWRRRDTLFLKWFAENQ